MPKLWALLCNGCRRHPQDGSEDASTKHNCLLLRLRLPWPSRTTVDWKWPTNSIRCIGRVSGQTVLWIPSCMSGPRICWKFIHKLFILCNWIYILKICAKESNFFFWIFLQNKKLLKYQDVYFMWNNFQSIGLFFFNFIGIFIDFKS